MRQKSPSISNIVTLAPLWSLMFGSKLDCPAPILPRSAPAHTPRARLAAERPLSHRIHT